MTAKPARPQPLTEFLRTELHGGPAVGLVVGDIGPALLGADRPPVIRTVSGAAMRDLSGLYAEFARTWRFPEHFGANKDAFDDTMRDLGATDGDVGDTFVTRIVDAHDLLAEDDDAFAWFAGSLDFYADHYRRHADPPSGFAVLLTAPRSEHTGVRARWHDAGVDLAAIGDPTTRLR